MDNSTVWEFRTLAWLMIILLLEASGEIGWFYYGAGAIAFVCALLTIVAMWRNRET